MKQRWSRGEVAFGAWSSIGSPYVAELLALEGFHYVCFDQQHGLIGYDTLVPMLHAVARTQATPIARVPQVDSAWIAKTLDAGAEGIVIPMVNSREDAEHAVAACRYFPEGNRSYGPMRAVQTLGGDPSVVNIEVACVVMIETTDAVNNADEICSVPGVDAVYIGPADLAITLGLKPGLDIQPGAHADAIEKVLKACKSHGIAAGIQCGSGQRAIERAEQGFTMITVGSDANFLRAAARSELAKTSTFLARPGTGVYA
jgi:4-hydroxy-2-oxoheptanedioate aldolase